MNISRMPGDDPQKCLVWKWLEDPRRMQQRSASIAIPTRISCVTRSNPFTAPILIITNAQLYYVAAADVGIIASLPEMTIFRFLLVQRCNCTAKVRPSTPFVAIFHRGVRLVIKGRDNYPPTTQITSPREFCSSMIAMCPQCQTVKGKSGWWISCVHRESSVPMPFRRFQSVEIRNRLLFGCCSETVILGRTKCVTGCFSISAR